MFNNSLKTRLITYTIVLVFLIAASFLTFYVHQVGSLIEDQLVEFGFYLSEDLSFSSVSGTKQEEPSLLQPALQDSLKEEEVLLAAVYDKQGQVMISSRKEQVEVKMSAEVKEQLLNTPKQLKRRSHTEQGTPVYNFYVPIRTEPEQDQEAKLVGFAGPPFLWNKLRCSAAGFLSLEELPL